MDNVLQVRKAVRIAERIQNNFSFGVSWAIAVLSSEDGYGSSAGSDLDKIGPADSSINFSVLANSDCSSFKHG